jgi:protein-glutamine gamma-glutamyltransferase
VSGAVAGAPRIARPRVAIPPLVARLIGFGTLAAFCLGHYAMLVHPVAAGDLAVVVLLGVGAGVALARSERIPSRLGTAARVGVLVVLMVAALAVTGLAPKLLLPGNWGSLADGLSRGFAGLDSFTWPYADNDHWVRLTIQLAIPLLLVAAVGLAFWPLRRGRATVRVLAVVPLLAAYATGVTDLELGAWAARGAALLLLLVGYLWLPRLGGRQALTALAAVAGCGLVALPLAAGLNARAPWVDYRHWNWFAQHATGTTFAWDHKYGPISWSRTGTKLLAIRSAQPHYWKAETLDRFDGLRWMHSESAFQAGTAPQDIPEPIRQSWNEQITVTVRRLTTKVIIGAGTVYRVDSDRVTADEPDGTVRILDAPLKEGASYKVYAYVPDPTAAQMRAAPRAYPDRLAANTYFDLPAAGQSGLHQPGVTARDRLAFVTGRTVRPLGPNQPLTASERQRVLASPYGRVYMLARRLAAGKATTYDVVRSVENHLQAGFNYSEKPPLRRYPLSAFLFRDKLGYCQQFSGAMALLLRMDGIPARVATGFSPGSFNHATNEYEVRDLDAHSWVEVWFTGIGWVPFDPTPSLAPAGSQSSGRNATSAARGGRGDDSGATFRAGNPEASAAGGGTAPDGGSHLWLVLLGLGVAGVGGFAVLWLAGIVRARAHFAATAEGAVDELRAALERLGYSYPARTTLSELERRLRVTGGDPAARYVRLLRTLRYAPPGDARPPGQRERRELRRALTSGGSPLTRLRGLVVLPPHPRRRAF